jgi:hypothetical protein
MAEFAANLPTQISTLISTLTHFWEIKFNITNIITDFLPNSKAIQNPVLKGVPVRVRPGAPFPCLSEPERDHAFAYYLFNACLHPSGRVRPGPALHAVGLSLMPANFRSLAGASFQTQYLALT